MLETSNALNTVYRTIKTDYNINLCSENFKDVTMSNQQVVQLIIEMLHLLMYVNLRDFIWRTVSEEWLRESPVFCMFMVLMWPKTVNVSPRRGALRDPFRGPFGRLHNLSIIHPNNELNPNWVSGFTDAEGCFSVIMEIGKVKRVRVSFEINLHEKDIEILYKIQAFFKVGAIYHRPEKKIAVYRVTNANYLKTHIIPHFLNFPLISKKLADFILWAKVVDIILSKDHLTEKGFSKILSYYASINRGASKKVSEAYNISPAKRPEVILPKKLNPHWVSGFVAGDGGFSIYVRPAKDYALGEKVYYKFHVAQHSIDQNLLRLLITFFGCGVVNVRTIRCDYMVQDVTTIWKLIVPHFDTYPLLAIKSKDYLCFRECIELVINKQHLTVEGLNRIKQLSLEMNNNRV